MRVDKGSELRSNFTSVYIECISPNLNDIITEFRTVNNEQASVSIIDTERGSGS